MEISQLSFVLLAAYSLCFGVMLGAVYELIRLPRVLLFAEHGKINYREIKLPGIGRSAYPLKDSKKAEAVKSAIMVVGDVLFGILCGVTVVMVSCAYNSGRVRAIIFAGLAVGFGLYYFTVGKLVMAGARFVAFLIRSAWTYLIEAVRLVLKKYRMNKKERSKNDVRSNRKNKIKLFSR